VVVAADVLAALSAAPTIVSVTEPVPAINGARAAEVTSTSTGAGTGAGTSTSTVWRLMAERTTQSWTSVPHFFLVRDVAASGLLEWRERALRQHPEKVTFTDLLIRVVAESLQRHPRLNASWREDRVAYNDEINIGIAVAVEDGLVVPVIHRTDDLSLTGIARRRADLVERAQAGKLRLADLQDGTFTISNLGMYGVDAFNAIISTPQAAILAVGRVADRVVPVDGQPAVRPMLTLSLSCDHRVVDGARGAEFLETVASLIENPAQIAG
jgi:pyruvate dehydrogenase E2 component (dihydrolipoamide acetyltransferase)